MKMNKRISGPALRFRISGTLSRRAKAGLALMRLGAWLVRTGGVKVRIRS